MKLIPQYREALRMHSVRGLLFIIALPALWELVPLEIKAMIPPPWLPWIMMVLAIATLLGRLVDQRTPEQRKADEVANEIVSIDDTAVTDRLRDRAKR
ncbi:hypothetical protein [Paracoccus hibiscisoli]|uniref:DUF7940 domain-containing protein n=1 Tax=Paracoccus hibiscisoli TaxID=2023261 RepID=UPI0023F30FFE|nr:hypothetical protein [Paracoccus hibiscisoli]